MGLIYANLSMSLDGYIAGPNVSVDNGMGDDGDRLHDWMFAGKSGEEAEAFLADGLASVGAFVMGRTMLDVGIGPWGDNPVFHGPVFVVTHRRAEPIRREGGTTYTFVTEGPKAALDLARDVAGGRDIRIMGGAMIVREYLRSGVIDELRLDIVPILLGGGTPLFTDSVDRSIDLAGEGTVDPGGVAHLRYVVRVPSASAASAG
jgi:dihydrofolate reductase